MKQDIDSITAAFEGLNDLIGSMSCGCVIQEDPPYTLDLIARMCESFLKEHEEWEKQRKEVFKHGCYL